MLAKRHRRKVVSFAVALGVVLSGGTVAVTAPSALAATQALGVGELSGDVIGWQGSMLTSDGSAYVFCTDPGTEFPAGNDSPQGYVTSWKGVSGNRLAGVNAMLNQIGANDRDHAAANFVVKHVFDPNAMYQTHFYPNNGQWPTGNLGKYIEWVLSTTYPDAAGGWQGVRDRALELLNLVDTTVAGSGGGTGSGAFAFNVDGQNNYLGTITMNGTPGSTGTITLTNGVFTDTGSATRTDAVAGVAYNITGVPTPDGQPYKISATGQFTPPGTAGYLAEVALWSNPEQNMVAAGRMASPTPFDVVGEDPTDRTVAFHPDLTTTAMAHVEKGQKFTDVVRFGTRADEDGLNNSWYSDEEGYVPVFAEGTIYGPYARPFGAPSDDVPADAPVAGHMTLTTGPDGPTVEYTVESDETAESTGYYYYVWSIDEAEQDAYTQLWMADGWYFQDQFGLSNEQSIVPMDVTATTQVPAAEVPLSAVPADTAQIANQGFWLESADGEKIPVTVRWDAYYDAGTEPVTQVPATEIPADATLIGSYTTQVTEPGQIATPADAEDLGFITPASGEGFIVWVLSIRDADQGENADVITEWSDDYGVPTEIQTLAQPNVATNATAGIQLGEIAIDVATVGGTLPGTGANLSFDAYKVPVDAEGNAPADLSTVCVEENRIFENHGEPRLVTEPGDYPSPDVTIDEYSKILWVERLTTVPANGEEPVILDEGECGIPNETTFVLDVTTKAQNDSGKTTVEPGMQMWDTVELTGWLPEGGSVKVELFQFDPSKPACTTPIWTSEAVEFLGGLHTEPLLIDMREEGQTTTAPKIANGMQLGFVETTYDAEGRIVSKGECGEPDETFTVTGSALALTGGNTAFLWSIGGGAAGLLAIGAVVLLVVRRRNMANTAA